MASGWFQIRGLQTSGGVMFNKIDGADRCTCKPAGG
jgi:hypothetical protein